jgi:hypothetical protein
MKSLSPAVTVLLVIALAMSGCWANPAAVRIESDPPGATVWHQRQNLGVTPIEPVLACTYEIQHVRLELTGYPFRDIMLQKRPIRYYVPWFAVVAAGIFIFTTTWRSEACAPEKFSVDMANGRLPKPALPPNDESDTTK